MRFQHIFSLAVVIAANDAIAAKVRQLYESPSGAFFENIVVRPNGHLLISSFDQARLYTLDPTSNNTEATIVAQFPNATALTGSARVGIDKYAVSGGVLNQTAFTFDPDTVRIWTIDFASCKGKGGHSSAGAPVIETVADVTGTRGGVNGMASLPAFPHMVLSADSFDGRIYRIDTLSGQVDIAFQDALLAGTDDPDALVPLGVNGIRVADNYLYWTNSRAGTFGRVRIAPDGSKEGTVEVIATLQRSGTAQAWDDFAITNAGVAYASLHANALSRIDPNGTQTTLVGGGPLDVSEALRDPTSVALRKDGKAVYVTTAGTTIDGRQLGGQIVEVVL